LVEIENAPILLINWREVMGATMAKVWVRSLLVWLFFASHLLISMEPPQAPSQLPSKKARQLFERDDAVQAAHLLKEGADRDTSKQNKVTLLQSAVFKRQKEAVVLLLCDTNVNAARSDGITALHIAAQKGYADLTGILLEAGAQVNATKYEGSTPLHAAAQKGYEDVVKVLLAAGAHVMCKRRNHATPLHLAAQNGHAQVVGILLKAGAEINARAAKGMTPLFVAAHCGFAEVVRVLLDNGADATLAAEGGMTPLSIAQQKSHQSIVTLLIVANARKYIS
jgi:ankyrin repeat protein